MNLDLIGDFISAGDVQQLPQVLLTLSDEERREVRDQVYTWYRAISHAQETTLNPSREKGRFPSQAAALAVLACGSAQQAGRVQLWWFAGSTDSMQRHVLEIFKRRRPGWADSWLEKQIAGESFFPWALLESLVAEGVCRRPDSDDFVRFLGDRFNDFKGPLAPRLRERLDFLGESLWRLFEVPSNAFTLEPGKWIKENNREVQSWAEALIELSAAGDISRDRLLDEALAGLAREFQQNVYSGIAGLVRRLKPTAAEWGARQAILRELLGSPASLVVKLALGGLKKAKGLEVEELLRAAGPVPQGKVKGNAMDLLKWVGNLSCKQPGLVPLARPLFETGCLHADLEVREFSEGWLAEQGFLETAVDQPEDEAQNQPSFEPHTLDRRWWPLLGVESNGYPPPFALGRGGFPRLSGLQPVEPIKDLQELIDAVGAAVEECDSGLELERLLGGLCRLCAERPPDFSQRTQALLHRLANFTAGETIRGLSGSYAGIGYLVRRLLLSWLKEAEEPLLESTYYTPVPGYPFLRERLLELTRRVANKRAGPMLSEPTHQGGWIDSEVLAARLSQYPGEPDKTDLIQALLRTTAEISAIDAWPLDVRLAAHRAVHAREVLTQKAFAGLGERARQPIWFDWTPTWVGDAYKHPRLVWKAPEPAKAGVFQNLARLFKGPSVKTEFLPTAQLQELPKARSWQCLDLQGAWIVRWLAFLWPGDLCWYWRLAADSLVDRLNEDAATTFPNFAFFDPFFDADLGWGQAEYLVLTLGLAGKDADVKGLAVDAAIEGVADGRAHPTSWLEVMLKLHDQGWLKPNRLAATLGEVARVSRYHRRFVAELLNGLLEQKLPKGGHHLLELMLEVGDGLGPAARESLQSVSAGSSKTAKLAKRLLQLGRPSPLAEFRDEVLVARAQRVRRWSE